MNQIRPVMCHISDEITCLGGDEADHNTSRRGTFWQVHLCGQEPPGSDRRKHYVIR